MIELRTNMENPPGVFGSFAGERCGRGMFGGPIHAIPIQQEAMMTVNYNQDTQVPVPSPKQPPVRVGKSATEARQGVISGRVLLVLVVSTALAIVGLAVAYVVA